MDHWSPCLAWPCQALPGRGHPNRPARTILRKNDHICSSRAAAELSHEFGEDDGEDSGRGVALAVEVGGKSASGASGNMAERCECFDGEREPGEIPKHNGLGVDFFSPRSWTTSVCSMARRPL